jgi:hypothetical protein
MREAWFGRLTKIIDAPEAKHILETPKDTRSLRPTRALMTARARLRSVGMTSHKKLRNTKTTLDSLQNEKEHAEPLRALFS